MTYSIVARDPQTGALGVAVQTYWFGVGSAVPWAEPGVGVVANQSFTDISYGPLGLDLMRGGKKAPGALGALLHADPEREVRQVAMVDPDGTAVAHTGSRCVEAAGHVTAEGVSCQANMMERDTVWDAMLAAYSSSEGDLAERMLAALLAAEAEGGDIRGRQSAALIVVPPPGAPRWERTTDLRVDDHGAPLDELARLLKLDRAWSALGEAGDRAFEGRTVEAEAAYALALELDGDDPQVAFWAGTFRATQGDTDAARELFERARRADVRWAPYLRRIAAIGLFPDDAALMDSVFPL